MRLCALDAHRTRYWAEIVLRRVPDLEQRVGGPDFASRVPAMLGSGMPKLSSRGLKWIRPGVLGLEHLSGTLIIELRRQGEW